MEGSSSRYDLEALAGDFPSVRFILLKEPISPGEEINIAAAELSSPLIFVLWSDLRILRSGGAERVVERLLNAEADVKGEESRSPYKRLCTVPIIEDGRQEIMPTLVTPALISKRKPARFIKTIPFFSRDEGVPSLYPFDGVGIYDRKRFIRLGGFDASIKSFHWQLTDFGFRSSLWGEKIASTRFIKLKYEGLIPQKDSTAEEGYKRFFLKNLAPVFRSDYAHIPLRRFPWYWIKMGNDLFSAWEEFSAAREWVKTNRYRFTSDARTIVERWETLDTSGGNPEDSDEKDNASREDAD